MTRILTYTRNHKNQAIINDLASEAFSEVELYFETEPVTSIESIFDINPDIIFMDVDKPKNEYYSSSKSLKKNPRTNHLPIVFIIEFEESGKLSAKALNAGCDAILRKPFNKPEFEIVVKTMQKHKENNLKKSIENDLRIEKERADNIIEGINAGTWDWDIVTDEMIINQRWAEMLGYTYEELQPVTINTWKELTNQRDLIVAEQKLTKHFRKKIKYYYAEFRMRHKNGNWVWINSRGRIVEYGKNRQPLRMAGTHIDITHKKATENELLKAKYKAEESDRLKSAFLSNMSHEIRTPMNGILGFIDLLKEPELNLAKQRYYIDIVKRSGERLLDTINDIIELSKIEAGESPLQIVDVNIDDLLQFFQVFFMPQAEKKGLILRNATASSDYKTIAKTDNSKLESILINLIKNAIKFTPSGNIEFGYAIERNKLHFFVKDSGIGIPEDKLDIIFERFMQLNLKFNRGHEGSGLGLSIAKAYSEMLGGKIWVTSEVGKGSTFHFTIDYKPLTNKKIEIYSHNSKDNFKETGDVEFLILVAEDEEVNYLLMEQFLIGMNLKLIHAENGKAAVETCKANPDIALILMDIKMPVMDGFAAATQIRKFRPNLPIIAQTAYALTHEIKEFDRFFDDYVIKPINKTKLIQKILNFIN